MYKFAVLPLLVPVVLSFFGEPPGPPSASAAKVFSCSGSIACLHGDSRQTSCEHGGTTVTADSSRKAVASLVASCEDGLNLGGKACDDEGWCCKASSLECEEK